MKYLGYAFAFMGIFWYCISGGEGASNIDMVICLFSIVSSLVLLVWSECRRNKKPIRLDDTTRQLVAKNSKRYY